MTDPSGIRHVFQRPVRFADIDAFHHVNNVRFLDYLEDARLAMFHVEPHHDGERGVHGLVVARHEIEYRRPLEFRHDPVRVESWVTEVRPVRFTLAHEVRDDEHVYLSARSVMVAYDLENTRPRRLTDDEREYLSRFHIPA
ncbi:acyl-CoA thioesterase [Bailinhaonella thermotolerans]|uniref:Acyl-CoA thioesterase n=1 Tax=Bailinhaonella thermotolerans TaxID=1070861 RepID=A0A3A4A4Q4_9ACTN|nr:thioesterase family protein [Bailinhaonella thermotolerans]RJL22781.1 acyl-CoA thioesterase [Bailinhaonella thermotolerans]